MLTLASVMKGEVNVSLKTFARFESPRDLLPLTRSVGYGLSPEALATMRSNEDTYG